jgi:hypothetical protein
MKSLLAAVKSLLAAVLLVACLPSLAFARPIERTVASGP